MSWIRGVVFGLIGLAVLAAFSGCAGKGSSSAPDYNNSSGAVSPDPREAFAGLG
jgi:hypothetical protein